MWQDLYIHSISAENPLYQAWKLFSAEIWKMLECHFWANSLFHLLFTEIFLYYGAQKFLYPIVLNISVKSRWNKLLYQFYWNKVHNLCHWVNSLLKLTLAKILSHCFQRYFGHKIWAISYKDIFDTNFEAYFSKIVLVRILSYCRTIYHISPWLPSWLNVNLPFNWASLNTDSLFLM